MILDIGCGDGTAAATAAPLLTGHRLIGVDWSQDALRRARPRMGAVVRGELEHGGLPLADGCADAVLFSEVLEHLVDPDQALDELRRVLRPGGHLISTPNLAAWYNRALLLAGVAGCSPRSASAGSTGAPVRRWSASVAVHRPRAALVPHGVRLHRRYGCRGTPFHGVPRPLRLLDRAACAVPGASSILLAHARRR
ncbi:class I SAM-dependent methyltransferase [Streptomyces californicus]